MPAVCRQMTPFADDRPEMTALVVSLATLARNGRDEVETIDARGLGNAGLMTLKEPPQNRSEPDRMEAPDIAMGIVLVIAKSIVHLTGVDAVGDRRKCVEIVRLPRARDTCLVGRIMECPTERADIGTRSGRIAHRVRIGVARLLDREAGRCHGYAVSVRSRAYSRSRWSTTSATSATTRTPGRSAYSRAHSCSSSDSMSTTGRPCSSARRACIRAPLV